MTRKIKVHVAPKSSVRISGGKKRKYTPKKAEAKPFTKNGMTFTKK